MIKIVGLWTPARTPLGLCSRDSRLARSSCMAKTTWHRAVRSAGLAATSSAARRSAGIGSGPGR